MAELSVREQLIIRAGNMGYNSYEVAEQLGYPVEEVNRAFLKVLTPPPVFGIQRPHSGKDPGGLI